MPIAGKAGKTVSAVGSAISDGSVTTRAFENINAFVFSGLQLPGLVALSQGFMLSSVVWAATAVCLVERRLNQAAAWMGAGAVMAFFGFIHAGELSVKGNLYSLGFATGDRRRAVGYALSAAFFTIIFYVNRRNDADTSLGTGAHRSVTDTAFMRLTAWVLDHDPDAERTAAPRPNVPQS